MLLYLQALDEFYGLYDQEYVIEEGLESEGDPKHPIEASDRIL